MKKQDAERFVVYRQKMLPIQLDRARRRYVALIREAKRMGMTSLLTNDEMWKEPKL